MIFLFNNALNTLNLVVVKFEIYRSCYGTVFISYIKYYYRHDNFQIFKIYITKLTHCPFGFAIAQIHCLDL